MSVDCSRFTFHPWKDYFGVVMQQGRVHLDADWNEWVAELARRLQAGTMDTLGPAEAGRAVVPSTTPHGFEILAGPGDVTIGPGRVYVDGLLIENHGAPAIEWDPRLAELTGTAALSFFAQPYLPFNAANEAAPADVFNRPILAGGPHLVYVDVWQRELTHLQDPDLVEKAVGVDTTARMQTVWQVRVLQNTGDATCATDDEDVRGWSALIQPSGARLTTTTGDVAGDPNPCLVPPAAGYKGLENQLYRVEIHRGGGQATATFKWSRDNATVATRVTEIHTGNRLVVESIGRDDVLGFHPGEWIEVVDDWHELHGRPGVLRRISPGDGVDAATRSILLVDELPAGLFPVDAQGRTDETRRTRIRRWDQSNAVLRADGTEFHDFDASGSSEGIPMPPGGVRLSVERGILLEFSLDPAGGVYRTGDYWVFAARVADGSIDELEEARPRGIHHHYARLAMVTLPNVQEDCRIHWPPAGGGESCDCTVCVHPEEHNAGTATIQQAIDFVRTRGGTVCLDTGTYLIGTPLNLDGAGAVRIRGQGWRTLLQGGQAGAVIDIVQATGVTIENLAVLGVATGGGTTALVNASQCVDLQLSRLVMLAVAAGDATSAAIGLSRLLLGCTIRDCTLVAERGVVALEGEQTFLLTANLRIVDNLFFCSQRGVSLDGTTLHYGEARLAGNLLLQCSQAGVTLTGGAFPNASLAISGNVMQVTGAGVRAGTDGLRIDANEIVGAAAAQVPADAIVLEPGFGKGAIDHAMITGNRIRGFGGNGIAIRHTVGQAMIKSNIIEAVGRAAIAMENDASAAYLSIENNHFSDLGVGFNQAAEPYFGVHLLGAARADVTANLFANVGRQATQSPGRAALAVQASAEIRVADNRFFGIGPERFVGRTIAVAVGATFRQLAIDDNTAARIGDSADQLLPAQWQAIVVGTRPAPDSPGGSFVATPGVIIAPLNENALYLSGFRVGLLPAVQGTASVRGNRLRSQSTVAPAVEIDDVVGCLLNQNDAETTGTAAGAAPAPVVRVQCRHSSAAGNRLIAAGDAVTFVLNAPRFAVMGNITSGPIQVNGAALPAPWNALNVPA